MSRDRVYTRRELESLRRADLQNLYRIHGLKGANQRSDVLVDGLVDHYSSPGFVAPAPPQAAVTTATHPRHANRLKSIEGQIPVRPPSAARSAVDRQKPARVTPVAGAPRRKSLSRKDSEAEKGSVDSAIPETTRPTSSAATAAATSSSRSFSQPAVPLALPAQVKTLWKRLEALESRSSPSQADIEDIRSELRDLQGPVGTSSRVTLEQVEEMLKERDHIWEERIRLVEAKWEERFQAVIDRLPDSTAAAAPPRAPHVTVTEDTPTALASKTNLGKRRSNPSSSPQTAVDSHSTAAEADAGSPRKRARVQGNNAASHPERTFRMPKTPEARATAPEPPFTPVQSVSEPRTPSPSHQGTPPDNSKTPSAFGPDFFADLPRPIATPDKRHPSAELVYPVFATTPKPHEPRSPTLDAPPSASRSRANYGNISMLTPGRVQRAGSAPRAVSQAHMDLSTITEATEEPLLASVARQRTISDEPTPADLLGPSLARDRDATLTPPRLSPSPSIADSHFSQVPLPHASGRKVSLQTRGTGTTPPRMRAGSSPAREYMEVALRGLNNPNESPSALATPGHRTMLGTERYRDTRFGDVPMPAPAWPSPRVDLMSTPGAGSARSGE